MIGSAGDTRDEAVVAGLTNSFECLGGVERRAQAEFGDVAAIVTQRHPLRTYHGFAEGENRTIIVRRQGVGISQKGCREGPAAEHGRRSCVLLPTLAATGPVQSGLRYGMPPPRFDRCDLAVKVGERGRAVMAGGGTTRAGLRTLSGGTTPSPSWRAEAHQMSTSRMAAS